MCDSLRLSDCTATLVLGVKDGKTVLYLMLSACVASSAPGLLKQVLHLLLCAQSVSGYELVMGNWV